MVELGIAIALGKPTFLFRDDFRKVTDSEEYPLNLMLFTGMPQDEWRDYYYTTVEEIGSPEKALARWVIGGTALTLTLSQGERGQPEKALARWARGETPPP